jgi:hypothetical protein
LTTITQRIITAIKNVFSKFKDENKDTLSYSVEFSDKFIAYGEFPILTARKWSDLKYPLTQQEIEIFFKALAEV